MLEFIADSTQVLDMKVLITGGAGFLGSGAPGRVPEVPEQGLRTRAVLRLRTGRRSGPQVRLPFRKDYSAADRRDRRDAQAAA